MCVKRKIRGLYVFIISIIFCETFDIPSKVLDRYSECENLKWYSVLAGDDYKGNIKNRNK